MTLRVSEEGRKVKKCGVYGSTTKTGKARDLNTTRLRSERATVTSLVLAQDLVLDRDSHRLPASTLITNVGGHWIRERGFQWLRRRCLFNDPF
jgi:hypothetical protein